MAKKEKTGKGTRFTESGMEQRSYFLPKGMGDMFRASRQGNASAGARGALLLFMAHRQFPGLQDRAIHAAEQVCPTDATVDRIEDLVLQEVATKLIEALRTPMGIGLSSSMARIRDRLISEASHAAIADHYETLPESEKVKRLAEARKKGAQ